MEPLTSGDPSEFSDAVLLCPAGTPRCTTGATENLDGHWANSTCLMSSPLPATRATPI